MSTLPSDKDIDDACRRRAGEDPRYATAWALLQVATALRSLGSPEAATARAIQHVARKLDELASAVHGVAGSIDAKD